MERDIIALVGAGQGGTAILKTLLNIPGAVVKHVYDLNPEAPGIQLAKKHDITCHIDGSDFKDLANNADIHLIFEVTGQDGISDRLRDIKSPRTNLVGASGTKIVFHLLDAQSKVRQALEGYKKNLEMRIIERTEEIEKANKRLQSKVLEYEELHEKLLKLDEEKTRYLLQATHQLKAPFAAIQSYTDIVLEGYTGDIPEQTREIVNKIKTRCELLARNIKEMLELANLKSTIAENVMIRKTDFADVIPIFLDVHSVIAEQRNVKFNVESPPKGTFIKCNRGQIATLFSILVDNAINYSDDGSQIDIFTKHKKNKLLVFVRDYGIGIPDNNIPKIFNEYFRSNNAVKHHENGSGLGLSVAREIAKINNLSIEVDSQIDKGTTFIIGVPFFREES